MDETFDGSFDIGGRWVQKAELSAISEFSLLPFLLSVWNIIVSSYPDTSDGAETYRMWTKPIKNKPDAITTSIGRETAMRIKVKVDLPETPSLEEKESDLGIKKGPTEKTAEPETVEAEIVDDAPYPETKTVTKEGRTYIQHAENNIINIEYLGELHV